MPEGNVNEQLKRLDSLDSKTDKKISVIEGKEDQLTKTYLGKTEDLLAKVDELEDEDPTKEEIKTDLLNFLKGITDSNIEEKEAEFIKKVDGFVGEVEQRIEIQNKIENLDVSSKWGGLLGIGAIRESFRKALSSKGKVEIEKVATLENYVNKSGEIALKYQEAVSYFLKGQRPLPNNNDVMAEFISVSLAEKILNGSELNSQQLLEAFELITKTAQEKREKCEKFENNFKDFASKTAPGSLLAKLGEDRDKIIEIYSVLIEKNGMSEQAFFASAEKLASLPEFKALLKEGYKNTDDVKIALMETALRGVNDDEIKSIQAELYAEGIFRNEQNKLDEKLQPYAKEVEKINLEISRFKEKYTTNGCFYGNLLIDRQYSVMVRENGVEKETEMKGNFTDLIRMEKSLEENKANALEINLQKEKSKADFSSALEEIDKMGDKKSLAEMKEKAKQAFDNPKIWTPQMSILEMEVLSTKEKADSKTKILENEQKLSAELAFRQAIEGGEKLEDENSKKLVSEGKKERLKTLEQINQSLKKDAERFSKEAEDMMAKYGSIDKVPEEEKNHVKMKLTSIAQFLGYSLKYLSEEKSTRITLKLLNSEESQDLKIQNLNNEFNSQATILTRIELFQNKQAPLYDIDSASSEMQELIFGQLNEKVSPKLRSAVDGLMQKTQEIGHYFDKEMPTIMQQREHWGRGTSDVFSQGVKKFGEMEAAIYSGRAMLNSAKEDLRNEKRNISGIFEKHPELISLRNKLIDRAIAGIDNVLKAQFSTDQALEVEKMKEEMQKQKDEFTWKVIKTAIVFAVTIASSMVTAGLAGAAAGRLGQFLLLSNRTISVIKFAATNLASAAETTLVRRGAKEFVNLLPGEEESVDWSFKAIASDFVENLATSITSNSTTLIGEKTILSHFNKIAKIKGFNYLELSAAGTFKVKEKMLNTILKLGSKGTEKLVSKGYNFVKESVGTKSVEET